MRSLEDKRWFAGAVAILLAGMGAAMLAASLGENDAYDEGGHLAAGYSRLRLGDFSFNTEHPPLGNALSALPLLPLNPRLATEHPSWRQSAGPIVGALFLYRNRVPPSTLLLLGRIPSMVLTLALGVVLAAWTRAKFGVPAAVFALFLYATDPNFLAHGHYITTDIIAAVSIFVACISWDRFLSTGKWSDLAAAGIVLGLALLSKFSTLFLWPVFALLYLLRRPREWPQLATRMIALALISAAVIGIGYWPETIRVITGQLPLARHAYLTGLNLVTQHSGSGHPAYLLGQVSDKGWWYYFPVVFAVKTPTAVLALLLLLAPLIVRTVLRTRSLYVLTLPPAAYLAMSMSSGINIGVRHLLPVYPFLFVLLAVMLFKLRDVVCRGVFIAVVLVVALLQTAEAARAYPDFLAFFNTASGGSANGGRYLVDSNLDWGQAAKKLKVYMDSHGLGEVCLAYFGTTDLAYHGIRHRRLPLTWELEERRNMDCAAAISATLLHDVYVQPGSYAWLRTRKPDVRIGYSIYIYDLRKNARPPLTP